MKNAKKILALECFDTYLEQSQLLKNVQALAKYLSQQKTPFPVDQIKPTMTYIIDTEELMGTGNDELQLQLALSFVHAFRLSAPEKPIDQSVYKYMYRLFNLLNLVLNHFGEKDNQDDIISILQISNKNGLYALANDSGLHKEIFDTLIDIDVPDAVENLAQLINEGTRFPSTILFGICEKIASTNVKELLLKLTDIKQTEFIQGIRSTVQNFSGVECIHVYEKAAEILVMTPNALYSNIQVDLNNDDDQTREAAVKLLTNEYSKISFNVNNQSNITSLITRHQDRCPSIRVLAIEFAFNVLKQIKEFKSHKELIKQNPDVVKSTIETITKDIWDMTKERIVDKTSEVRVAVMKGLYRLDAKDIQLDYKLISYRLKDAKSDEVRVKCLKVMLKLYDSNPDELDWLIDEVIQLYNISKDVALFGFAVLMANHSLIEVAENLKDRTPLIEILQTTNEFRQYLPEFEKKDAQEVLQKYIDIKLLKKLIKKAPKNFIEGAIDSKKRKHINKVLKEKVGGSNQRLLMGLYQPTPFDVDDILKCKNLDVVNDLSKIFADEFEAELPRILKRLNKTDLTVLSAMKETDFDDDDRTKILKALVPITASANKNRDLALKVFAKIYRMTKANAKILEKIKFEKGKEEFLRKISFYGRFVDTSSYTKTLYDELAHKVDIIDKDTVKYALKIASAEKSERTIDIHVEFLEKFPAITFKSYLLCSNNCYGYISPDIFRKFAYVMQNEDCEVRKDAIKHLTFALTKNTTPIQMLALFALSATDPYEKNLSEAKKQLEDAITFRRKILKHAKEYLPQIAPETALPYLINILAHHKNIDEDLPELATFSEYMRFFLTPLCSGTTQFSSISDLFSRYSMLDDVDEEFTDNMVKLCNLGIVIVKELGQGKVWDPNPEDRQFEYSSRFFKQPSENRDRIKQILKQTGLENMKSPMKPKKLLRAGMEKSPRMKVKMSTLDEKEKKKGKRTVKSAPTSPMRKSKKPAKEQEKEEQEEENSTKTKKVSKAKSALSTPKITKRKASAGKQITLDKSPTKKKAVASPKKKAATESPSKKKAATIESPSKKKKVTLESPSKKKAETVESPSKKKATTVKSSPKRKKAVEESPKKATLKASPSKAKSSDSTPKSSPKRKPTDSPKKANASPKASPKKVNESPKASPKRAVKGSPKKKGDISPKKTVTKKIEPKKTQTKTTKKGK